MSQMLNVSASPHVRASVTTAGIMRDVLIALLPAAAFGVWQFGWHALLVILICMAVSVLTEYLYQRWMKLPVTVLDLSAAVTGLLLALNLPPEVPVFIPVIGSVFAVLVVKQLFGGLGHNFMNPALAARCFLLISFAGRMTTFTLDGISGATPLAQLMEGGKQDLLSMFLGNEAGTIGEVSAAAILLGAAYLLIRKVISPKIPLIYLGSFSVFILLLGGQGFDLYFLAAQLFGGGLMLGAWFMATDYVTSPITPGGKIVFGVILGLLTGLFRIYGNSAEGVSYAVIFCNLLVPLIEKFTLPKAFGREGKRSEA